MPPRGTWGEETIFAFCERVEAGPEKKIALYVRTTQSTSGRYLIIDT